MRRFALIPITLAVAGGLALLAYKLGGSGAQAGATTAPALALDSERARFSYLVGLDHARELEPIADEVDLETVIAAIREAHAGRKPQWDAAQTDAVRARFAQHLRDRRDAAQRELAAKNAQRSAAFLRENGAKAGVVTTASGLQYEVLRDAAGAHPRATDTVRVNYVGSLVDGSTFESTYATDHPAELVLDRAMPGWKEGVALMGVGAKYRFWIPPALAYAERGLPGQIEPNALVVFDVELLGIAGRGGAAE